MLAGAAIAEQIRAHMVLFQAQGRLGARVRLALHVPRARFFRMARARIMILHCPARHLL